LQKSLDLKNIVKMETRQINHEYYVRDCLRDLERWTVRFAEAQLKGLSADMTYASASVKYFLERLKQVAGDDNQLNNKIRKYEIFFGSQN